MATSLMITAATVLSTLTHVSGGTPNSQYYYNAEFENGKVSQINVLAHEGQYLRNKLSHRYEYDDQDRLVKKVTMLWDNTQHEWREYQVERYDYADNQMTLTLSRWNPKSQAYELTERYNYSLMMDHVVALTKEKWDDAQKDLASTEQVLLMTPVNDLAQTALLYQE